LDISAIFELQAKCKVQAKFGKNLLCLSLPKLTWP
jgi:hypothetical protein